MSEHMQHQVNPMLWVRQALGLPGWGPFVFEAGRNPFNHARAENVWMGLKKFNTQGKPSLYMIDDGIGMDEAGRIRAGLSFGHSTQGNGTGVRQSAVTVGQILTFYTIEATNPDTCWTITLPLVEFFTKIHQNNWNGQWVTVDRAKTPFPADLKHGTMLILSDFRGVRHRPGEDEFYLVDTSRQISEERIRAIVLEKFPADLARRVTVGGKQIKPQKPKGYILWKEDRPKDPDKDPDLVSGIISVAVGSEQLYIGGLTATVPFYPGFVKACAEHAPAKLRDLHEVFRDERVLAGSLYVPLLESFPQVNRESIMPDFFETDAVDRVIVALNGIALQVQTALETHRSSPRREEIDRAIKGVLTRMNEAVTTPAVATSGIVGEGSDTDESQRVIDALGLSKQRVILDPWDGTGHRDSVVVRVTNPFEGENFYWEDTSRVGLLSTTRGTEVTIQAPQNESIYLVKVSSGMYGKMREATITVEVRKRTALPSVDTFAIAPSTTHVGVGEEKSFGIRNQGKSSGRYIWSLVGEGADLRTDKVGRTATFVAEKTGKFTVICRDKDNPKIEATASVEVRKTPRPSSDGGEFAQPNVFGEVTAVGGRSAGRLAAADMLYFALDDWELQVRVGAMSGLMEPFHVVPKSRTIFIGEMSMDAYGSTEEDLMRFVAWCVGSGIYQILLNEGAVAPSQQAASGQILGHVLKLVMQKQ